MLFHKFNDAKLGSAIRLLPVIAGALSAGSMICAAESVAAQTLAQTFEKKMCEKVGEISGVLFNMRQDGADRSQLTETSDAVGQAVGDDIHSVLKMAVDGVLAYPILSDDDAKAQLEELFTASMTLACLDRPTTPSSAGGEESETKQADETPDLRAESSEVTEVPAWADAKYPNQDFNIFGLEVAHASGNPIHGYWTITIEQDEITGETETTAANVHNSVKSLEKPRISAFCDGREQAVGLWADTYLTSDRGNKVGIAYRLDGGEPVEARFLASDALAVARGKQAEAFIRELASASSGFFRITERDGTQHNFDIPLQGISEVAEIMADACKFSLLNLSREDYRRIQSLLNEAGFNAGSPDGIWGPGSKRAFSQFQEARGLEQTGTIDKASLSALGF